jgi:hypothetical protein
VASKRRRLAAFRVPFLPDAARDILATLVIHSIALSMAIGFKESSSERKRSEISKLIGDSKVVRMAGASIELTRS